MTESTQTLDTSAPGFLNLTIPAKLTRVAVDDGMFDPNDPLHYLVAGHSAMAQVLDALEEVGKTRADVSSVLDLPCGHGRVLRFLRAIFPEARFTACDLLRNGVDFCAATFGATPVYSSTDVSKIRLPDTYDLIWCGSLLTHLNVAGWNAFLDLFASVLRPGGVCLATTHGTYVARQMRSGRRRYGLEDVSPVLAGFDETGFGYADYLEQPGYGISLTSRVWIGPWLARVSQVRLVAHWERTWDGHQDVLVLQKVPDAEAIAAAA